MLPLGAVFSAKIVINQDMTEVLRSEASKEFGGLYGEPFLYIAYAMSLSIDNQFIPPEYKERIKSLKNIASVRINTCTFDDDGKRHVRPDSYIYFPDFYFKDNENIYEIVDDTSEDLMFVYVAPDKTCKQLMEELTERLP